MTMDFIMIPIWIVERGLDGEEGHQIIGIYSTEERAQAAAQRWNKNRLSYDPVNAIVTEEELDPEE